MLQISVKVEGYEEQGNNNSYWLHASGTEAKFTDWENGQPDKSNGPCVQFGFKNDNVKWHNVNCDEKNDVGYSCRFSKWTCIPK